MKKINKKVFFALFGITVLAVILRFWNLDFVPPSLDWDEASWGYNAYSLLLTGKDEYGKVFPIVVRSLNDYKPAMYAYLTIPAVWVFGLTDFAVRFSNALFGVFTVITTYFLAKELFKRRDIALISSFLMAISPWSIQFSRFAHEGTVGLEFNLLMVLFFLKGLRNPIFLSLSAFFAGLSLYSYQNEKAFVPLLALCLLIAFYKKLFAVSRKYLALAIVVGLVVSLPIVAFTFTHPESFTRAKGASFLNIPGGVLKENQIERLVKDKENNDLLGEIIDNRRVVYVKAILGNYLSHYDPNFLFIKGDSIGRHQPPGMGHLYLIELPFLLIGFYFLFFGKFSRESKIFIILWILVVPISASITWDVPNSGRTMNFLPTFQMIIAIGIVAFYECIMRLKVKKVFKYSIFGFIGLIAVFNFVYYLNQYFVQYRYFNSQDWQYGYNQIIPEILKQYPNFDKIVVSNRAPLDQSYIFFLYNLKFPPQEYQKLSSSGILTSDHFFDKFEFRQIKMTENEKGTLYIVSPNEIIWETNINTLKEIKQLDGKPSIIIVKGG